MASDSPNENLRRGSRRIRPTLRALEADLDISRASGHNSTSISPSLLPTPPETTPRSPSSVPASKALQDRRALTMNQPISPRDVADSIEPQARSRPQQPSGGATTSAVKGSDRVTKNDSKSRKTKAPARSRKSAQQPKKTSNPVRRSIQGFKTEDPLLQPASFAIYIWETPRPIDFSNLSQSRKAWKADVDAAQEADDMDPELDDWHEFSGAGSDIVSDFPLKSSIAMNFASRAKRAFRAGRSWDSFERDELSINSGTGAKATQCPYERKIALEYALDNDLRLYVFGEIKVRLCHEISLQAYPEPASASSEEEHLVKKKDSVINTATTTPNPTGPSRNGTAMPSDHPAALTIADGETTGQPRTRSELPGSDREVHQPQGPFIRATQTNMRGLGVSYDDYIASVSLDMATSDEDN